MASYSTESENPALSPATISTVNLRSELKVIRGVNAANSISRTWPTRRGDIAGELISKSYVAMEVALMGRTA
jgi:hypothetical protein